MPRALTAALALTVVAVLSAASPGHAAAGAGADHPDRADRADRLVGGHAGSAHSTSRTVPAVATMAAWSNRPTGTTTRFRGLAAVSHRVAWVSGTEGTILRTVDGGLTWLNVSPHTVDGFDTTTLQFRDIEAWDSEHAVVLSIGENTDSRIYRTDDGGATWHTTFVNAEPTAFYDCIGFWDRAHGLALSDPVGGKFRLQRTSDGGRTWSLVDPAGMPAALAGEFAFAASGTCLVTAGERRAWIATGGSTSARVLRSNDRGATWTAAVTPIRAGATAGIYSLAVRGSKKIVAVGGAFDAPTDGSAAAAVSSDGGATWALSTTSVSGYRSGVSWITGSGHGRGHGRNGSDGEGFGRMPALASGNHDNDSDVSDGHGSEGRGNEGRGHALIAVGPSGSDLSADGGRTWTPLDTGSLDSVACVRGACWGSGDLGRVAVLTRG